MARKVSLIPDWKRAWRFASIRISAIGFFLMSLAEILGASWNGLPASIQSNIPHATTIALILFGLGLIGRILKTQEPLKDGD